MGPDKNSQIICFTPETWVFAFSKKAARRWVELLVPGKFKHVLAFGFVPASDAWVVINPCFDRTEVEVIPNNENFEAFLLDLFDRQHVLVSVPAGLNSRLPAFGYWCTSMCAHLAGLPRSALRPDAFLKECLAHGGRYLAADDIGLTEGEPHGRDESTEAGAATG